MKYGKMESRSTGCKRVYRIFPGFRMKTCDINLKNCMISPQFYHFRQALKFQGGLALLVAILFQFALFSTLTCNTAYAGNNIDEYIGNMTINDKIGQILIIGIQGKRLTAADIAHLRKLRPGGIVLYARNITGAAGTARLISNMKAVTNRNNEFETFFLIDQEGGIVHRIEDKSYSPASAPAIGAANSKELARMEGRSVGSALQEIGININLAPVLDIPDRLYSPMGMRSFSDDRGIVERLAFAYIQGLKDGGIMATAKHFPGIGRAHVDSHYDLPRIIWKTPDEKNNDMSPFIKAIGSGLGAVMVAHVVVEPGDKNNPVSLSPYWLKEALRKELGFKGLIIADNIEMQALGKVMSISEAARRSFEAGADMIMVSHERKKQELVFNALLDTVRQKKISLDRLNASVKRIIQTKKRLLESRKKIQIGDERDNHARIIADSSAVSLKSIDALPRNMNKSLKRSLYAGYNFNLLNKLRGVHSDTEILNRPLSKFSGNRADMEKYLKPFDVVIIDGDYRDSTELILICEELKREYVLLIKYQHKIRDIIDNLKPKRVLIIFGNTDAYYHAAAEIVFNLRHARGKLPHKLKLAGEYVYE
jgi:beta-N-acetylhexosaminidase